LGLGKVGYGLAMAKKLHQLQICVHTVIANRPSLNQVYSSSGHSKDLITIPEYGLPGGVPRVLCDVIEYTFDQVLGIVFFEQCVYNCHTCVKLYEKKTI
jgi:hypothetical protein